MWCACKIGPRHWEENFVRVDWASQALVASEDENGEETQRQVDERFICGLVGLQVSVGNDRLKEECARVTCGDYDEVIVLEPKQSDFVCVLGVEDKVAHAWVRLLENASSICSYLETCKRSNIEVDSSLVQELQEKVMLPNQLRVTERVGLFDSRESTRAFTYLINSQTTLVSLFNTPLLPEFSTLFFENFSHYLSLCTLEMKRCSIGPQTAGQLCKALLGVSSHLQHLDLSHNDLGDIGANALGETLPCMVCLTSLKLGGNHIGAQGANSLGVSLRRLARLREFELYANPIGDAGVVSISASLGSLAYLENLILHACGAMSQHALGELIKGLIDNTNVSVVGGVHCLDLQDNAFDGSAVKKFLTQCSGLGSPQVIKLGRKRKERLMMAMEKQNGSVLSKSSEEDDPLHFQFRKLKASLPQMVDLGFIPDQQHASGSENGKHEPPLVEVVFGNEISPFKLVQAITNLLNLFPGQVILRAGQKVRNDNLQVIHIEINSHDGLAEDHCATLIDVFNQGNAVLHLLHVVSIRPVPPPLDSSEHIVRATNNSPEQPSVKSPARISVLGPATVTGQDEGRSEAGSEELEDNLTELVRKFLSIEAVASTVEDIRAQLRMVARAFACLNIFVPSDSSSIKRYLLEARLTKSELTTDRDASPPTKVQPMLAAAIGRVASCSPSDALIVRAYYASMFGDVERCVAAAEQGKYALGMMLSLSQVTHFESATLQAAVVAQDPELFSLVMSQDLSEDEIASKSIRLASLIHNDLFSRGMSLENEADVVASSSRASVEEQDQGGGAGLVGLVAELVPFSRLNAKWTPRELRLQFTKQRRVCPLTVPKPQHRATSSTDASRYWTSLGEDHIEEAYSRGAEKISELLLQAMGDVSRKLDDPEGYGAAHEAFGIAFSNRSIGLADELICQLMAQVTCNPSLRSMDVGWRLLVVATRILEPAPELCAILASFLENRMQNDLGVAKLVEWAQEALQRFLEETEEDRKLRRVFAADTAVRMDVLRQILCDDDAFEVDIHCANGTGTRVKIAPFTSFEDLLKQVNSFSTTHLFRLGPTSLGEDPRSRTRSSSLVSSISAPAGNQVGQENRWRDFVFLHESPEGGRSVMAWETDVFWWRWKCAIRQVLATTAAGASPSSREIIPAQPQVRLFLERNVCSPLLWYFHPQTDALRCELVFWQQQAQVTRGDMCTSNPEALAFLSCLSACIRISGGCRQFVDLDPVDQVRVCMGHVPTAVRKRVGRRRGNPWNKRFATVVTNFALALLRLLGPKISEDSSASEEQDTLESLGLDTMELQKAYIAYLEMWPLCNGVVFKSVVPLHLSVDGESKRLYGFEGEQGQKARLVVNSKGLFLLALTKDAHTSRAVGVLWWTCLDDIVRIQLLDPAVLLVSTRKHELELGCEEARKVYQTVVAQATANLSTGNPSVPRDVKLVQFTQSFRALPWPPPPPPLYSMHGEPVDLEQHVQLEMDLSTTASLLAQFL